MSGSVIVNSLAALLIITSILVVRERYPSRAALLYGLQSLVLVLTFVALAWVTHAPHLYLWAASAFVTKVLLVPAILYRVLGRFDQRELPPGVIGPAASVMLAAGIVAVAMLAVMPIQLPGAQAFRPALGISLAHFFLGLACIITQRNIVKHIFGYCLMENGSHLTLALLANQAPELVEIGIATDAIFAVIVMSFFATRIEAVLHSLDDRQLRTLRG